MTQNILEKQKSLQQEAKIVLEKLDLINILSNYGKAKIVGSLLLELMVWPDIDIDLESNKKINIKDYFEIINSIFKKENIKKITLIDNRNAFEKNRPQSMYIGIIYELNNIKWKLDIRYLNPSNAFARNDLKKIKKQLTPEKIQNILEIKTNLYTHPNYGKEFSGYDIYKAVIENNITTTEEFKNIFKIKN